MTRTQEDQERTLTVELEPQLEDQLREVAAQHGMDASAYARQLIERDLALFEASRKSLWNK